MTTNGVTPLRQQYLQIKSQYPDCILMFRLGDFYEMFDHDAEVAARELDLVLTGRPVSKGERVPMAGVPFHAVESYIARLIEKGYHVAVCEQVSEPDGRGIVEREVTRVITPGTIIEPALLAEDRANYLMAILPVGNLEQGRWEMAGLAYIDISTGEFAVTQLSGENAGLLVVEELARLSPREVLLPESWAGRGASLPQGIHLTQYADWHFEESSARQVLTSHFQVRTLDGFGLGDLPAAVCAAGAVIAYLQHTQRSSLNQITTIRPYSTASFMVLDQFTRQNLELTETLRGRANKGSLLGVLDRTVTAMGTRLMRTWLAQPLLEIERLEARLNAVEALTKDEIARAEMRERLRATSDLERLINRVVVGKATPRDLVALRLTLEIMPALRALSEPFAPLAALTERLDPCTTTVERVIAAITDDPPANMNQMGVIRAEYSDELNQILTATKDARDWIAQLEPLERQRTGISSLKVGFNKVFGYYIEVSHANTAKIPDDYIRKQTLVNAERYITPELKEYETLVLNAEEQILRVERRVFEEVCADIAADAPRILETARALAYLDAFCGLADVAVREGYVRPTLTSDDRLLIRAGRHPVVERSLETGLRYVPNDTHFDSMNRIHIITGPNMAGKSTYIRQVAIITLMAQVGSFVPADEAVIGIVDRIFARIGAQDEIHAGYSTFMVEMIETARILSASTARSLVILDEVGRGTSTYDGLAIARAVIEYLHNNPRLNCRTLFATHYHELTALPDVLPRARNYNVGVSEQGDEIVFLHRVLPGGADRSYGVQVAQLAGLPRAVVERARELLRSLEAGTFDAHEPPKKPARRHEPPAGQLSFFTPPADANKHAALDLLRALEVDNLSPIEALTKLYELKKLASQE
ncbi:MAG: DNA mismatch repair protein MutS [Pleurocapsa minor GSE-CHR-MK-17-07R]|jgi:DNA mismatch repair protein MutS|nr:DNA mismatch repair protein MutS [Pleurocapsa minor GSE-CHR-MK 17-07R]